MSYNEARELWLAEEEQRLLDEIANEKRDWRRKEAEQCLEDVRQGIVREPMEEEIFEMCEHLKGTWD